MVGYRNSGNIVILGIYWSTIQYRSFLYCAIQYKEPYIAILLHTSHIGNIILVHIVVNTVPMFSCRCSKPFHLLYFLYFRLHVSPRAGRFPAKLKVGLVERLLWLPKIWNKYHVQLGEGNRKRPPPEIESVISGISISVLLRLSLPRSLAGSNSKRRLRPGLVRAIYAKVRLQKSKAWAWHQIT